MSEEGPKALDYASDDSRERPAFAMHVGGWCLLAALLAIVVSEFVHRPNGNWFQTSSTPLAPTAKVSHTVARRRAIQTADKQADGYNLSEANRVLIRGRGGWMFLGTWPVERSVGGHFWVIVFDDGETKIEGGA